LPTIHGEKVEMRLLKKNASVPTVAELGLRGQALRDLEEAVRIPHGIVLITGPTGSGKTTTLYSLLHQINTPKVNISTLEDPVEYQMPGVNQVQINPQAGLTFASGLRAFLRQDPNIIMVGEIRDSETAELAIQASLTGHLVFSTLHTNSAAGALPRLIDMGAEPFLLASTLTLSMGQRVARRLNPKYLEEYTPEQTVVDDIKQVLGPLYNSWCTQNKKDPDKMTLFRPKADRPTNEGEYEGRIAIFEVLRVTEVISRMILEHKSAAEIEKAALEHGMLLMKQDGYMKALEGITTIEEVLRVAEV
jgi:type II secretory ATPase GspE/PulE/Tfp pilus assembly ATPase PilB-like protein